MTLVIGNLQVLRAIAALSVVFYHTAYLLPGGVHTDFAGVEIFFTISGFIMCFITRKHPDQFFRRRVVRIVPLYWLCTAFAFAPLIAVAAFGRHTPWPDDFLRRSIESALFLPVHRMPLLGVGWTLNYEMSFYLLFAIVLWLNRQLAPLIAAAVIVIGQQAIATLDCSSTMCAFYSAHQLRFFVFGIALFYAWLFVGSRIPRRPAVLSGALLIFLCYTAAFMPAELLPAPLVDAIPPIVTAAFLFMASAGADIRWRPLLLLGDASYAIYLCHPIVMQYVGQQPGSPGIASVAAIVALCAAIGVAVHLAIERPLQRTFQRLSSHPWTAKAEPPMLDA